MGPIARRMFVVVVVLGGALAAFDLDASRRSLPIAHTRSSPEQAALEVAAASTSFPAEADLRHPAETRGGHRLFVTVGVLSALLTFVVTALALRAFV